MATQVIYAITAAIIAALVTASAEFSSLASLDSSRVVLGEYWRLFSGHLSHLTWRQYAMDAPAFIILYSTYDRRVGPFSAIFLSLFAALSVSFAVIFTGIHEVYGGFSGLSCAAATAILMTMILENPRQAFPYFLCFIYCSYLLFMGGFASGVRVANEAHIAGAVSGLVFTLIRDRMLKLTSYCQPLRNTRHKVSRELNP